jgi:fatty acid desaturase
VKRPAATSVSFVLCLIYLAFLAFLAFLALLALLASLPFHAWALAVLVGAIAPLAATAGISTDRHMDQKAAGVTSSVRGGRVAAGQADLGVRVSPPG